MTFEYTGLQSLRDPEVFFKILASSASDTGLAYDFQVLSERESIDRAHEYFQYLAYIFLTHEEMTTNKALLGLSAIGIYSISLFKLFNSNSVVFLENKVVGLHAAAIRKNPNEVVALTFGLSIIEIQAEFLRSPTGLLLAPARIDLGAINPADVRHAIRLIAENRNRHVGFEKGQFRKSFWGLSRLIRLLRRRRFQHRRTPL